MRLALVAPSPVPHGPGGAERAWEGIVRAVDETTGHSCELVSIPTPETDLRELVAGYRAFAHLDVSAYDRVVSSKYPAWMAPHDDHLLYVFHRLRGLYDTYPLLRRRAASEGDRRLRPLLEVLRRPPRRAAVDRALDLADAAIDAMGADDRQLRHPGPVARELVHWLDAVAFDPFAGGGRRRDYLALSETVRARPGYFPPGTGVDVLHLPSDLRAEPTGHHHFFTASRLDRPKRLDLLLEAYRLVPGDRELRIAGTGPDEERLHELAAGDPRVRFLGYLDDAGLAAEYAAAVAVPFVPLDEDFGLVTVEAWSCGTAVVTVGDAGGPADLVTHGVDGFVTDPRPAALADAMTRIATEAGLAERMGEAGRARASRITWDAVVRRLTDTRGRRVRRAAGGGPRRRGLPDSFGADAARRPGRDRVVMLSTFPVAPALGGGQVRSLHLYGALGERFDVELVCLGPAGGAGSRTVLAPGVTQVVVPRSAEHAAEERSWRRSSGVDVSDVLAGRLVGRTPAYLDALRPALDGAAVALLAHPFLVTALSLVGADAVPVAYDAHNCEVALKETVLAGAPGADELLGEVVALEGAALHRAALTTVCSPVDADELARRHGVDRSGFVLVPNGVDVGATPFTTGVERDAATGAFLARYGGVRGPRAGVAPEAMALFLGSWHPPNIDAGRAVAALAPERPEVVFVLGGGHANAVARRGLAANVAPTGVVSEATKHALLRAATVALNPVVSGSGTNLKLVESLAAGAPVLTTPMGARGLPVVDGVHLVVAGIDAFAATLAELVADPGRHERAAAGRALVESELDWPVLARRLGDALATIVD